MSNKARVIKNLPKLILGGGGVTMGSLGCVAYAQHQIVDQRYNQLKVQLDSARKSMVTNTLSAQKNKDHLKKLKECLHKLFYEMYMQGGSTVEELKKNFKVKGEDCINDIK